GKVHSMDHTKGTLTLQDVVVFGTEDRPVQGPVIPKADVVYEFLVFDAASVQKLDFVDPVPTATSIPDPGVVEAGQSRPLEATSHSQQRTDPWGQATHHAGAGPDAPGSWRTAAPAPRQERRQERHRHGHHGHHSHRDSRRGGDGGGHTRAGRGDHLVGAKELDGDPSAPEPVDGEFDFQSANAKFDKEAVFEELSQEQQHRDVPGMPAVAVAAPGESTAAVPAAYNKTSSFFDTLSSDASDRAQGIDARPDRAKLRAVNVETFGSEGLKTRQSGGGRGRGRSHGYHSRGRGGYGGGGGYSGHRSTGRRGGGYRGGYGGGGGGGGSRRRYGSGDPSKD
ncbi:LSM14A, partial [Symbiodinium sp. KB8]